MKHTTLFILALCTFLFTQGQQTANLVVYSELGELFSLTMNGDLKTPEPVSRIRVTDLNQPFYQVVVTFTDPSKGIIKKGFNLNAGKETVAQIKLNKKGRYVLRWQSESPLSQAIEEPTPPIEYQTHVEEQPEPIQEVQHPTRVREVPSAEENMQVSIRMQTPTNLEIDMQIQETDQVIEYEETSFSTTTTSSATQSTQPETVNPLPGYSGRVGCGQPLLPGEFADIKRSIESKSFEDTKLSSAKQITRSRCLLSGQVRDIMKTFSYEDSRLDFAKYAYERTYDIDNYYKVNDAFEFELTTDELNSFLDNR